MGYAERHNEMERKKERRENVGKGRRERNIGSEIKSMRKNKRLGRR